MSAAPAVIICRNIGLADLMACNYARKILFSKTKDFVRRHKSKTVKFLLAFLNNGNLNFKPFPSTRRQFWRRNNDGIQTKLHLNNLNTYVITTITLGTCERMLSTDQKPVVHWEIWKGRGKKHDRFGLSVCLRILQNRWGGPIASLIRYREFKNYPKHPNWFWYPVQFGIGSKILWKP